MGAGAAQLVIHSARDGQLTQRRRLEERLTRLGESGEIMRSMKNLAFMETRRLLRRAEQQRAVVARIDAMAADFLSFNPQTLPAYGTSHHVYLVLGTQRGFCGDFNERLVAGMQREATRLQAPQPALIGVGRELCRRLEAHFELEAGIDGGDVAEDIPSVLRAIVDQLETQRRRFDALQLSVLHHTTEQDEPRLAGLLPPFRDQRDAPRAHANPPLLNLQPRDFFLELSDQYLLAALHAVLFESMLAENEQRLRHLDGAVRNLDRRIDDMRRRVQALRQEEIVEEIEVILLSAEAPGCREI